MTDLANEPMKTKPRFISDERQIPRIVVKPSSYKWADLLWPCMAWMIFFFNLGVGLHFLIDLYMLPREMYDYVKHITTAITIPTLFWAVVYIHSNITRNDYDGRMG